MNPRFRLSRRLSAESTAEMITAQLICQEQSRHLQCDSDVFLPYHTWTWQKLDQVLSRLPVTQNRFSWSRSLLASHSDFTFIYPITYRLRPLTSLEILSDFTCSHVTSPESHLLWCQAGRETFYKELLRSTSILWVIKFVKPELIFSRCCLVSCLSFHSVLINYSCCCCVRWIPDDVIPQCRSTLLQKKSCS